MKLPIKVDQSIQMQVPVGKLMFTCEAKILGIQSGSIQTTLPIRLENGAKIAVKVEQLTVFVPLPDAVYSLPCPVVEVGAEDLTLSIPADETIQRIQRREHVRVKTTLPCWIEMPRRGAYDEPFESMALNLSGGGCALINPKKLITGTQVRLTICLPDDESWVLVAKVKHERSLMIEQETMFLAGLEFQDIDEVQRGKIIRYVFDVERGKRPGTSPLKAFIKDGAAVATAKALEVKPVKWTAIQRRDVVIRMLRGEAPEALATELGVPTPTIEKWRERAMAAMEAVLIE